MFNRQVACPACDTKISVPAVKNSALRLVKRDSDSLAYYKDINPLFYEVWQCNHCGYAALKTQFTRVLNQQQIDVINAKVSARWQGRTNPSIIDLDTALSRFKMALYCMELCQPGDIELALIFLKLGWLLRLHGDEEREALCLRAAVNRFRNLYEIGDFPIAGMDEINLMYMMADLYHRSGDDTEAKLWLSRLMVRKDAKPVLKEKARDLKDLINELN